MAEGYQKVHPIADLEAPSPRTELAAPPLVPPGVASSEKRSPMRQQHPPFQTIPPVIHTRAPKARNCCCKCICWTIGLLVLLLVILAAIAAILYFVFRPKIPSYSIDKISINNLVVNFDSTLYAKFDLKITATNPNKKIGIYYEKGGLMSVWYTNTKLCQGSIPTFYQGHQNITKLDLSLTGQVQSGSTLMSAIQQQQQTGKIPLDLKIKAPVAIKLGSLKLRKVRISVDCDITVDNLSANSEISITASNCKYGLKL